MSGGRPRRVVTDVAQRRAEILDAAVGVVLERGFDGTRVVDVAKALGISSGLVHYHFDSKDELLAETLRHAADADIARLEKAVAELDDPIKRLDRVLSEYLPEAKTDQSWVIWVDAWGHAIRNDRLRNILKELDLAWSGALESVIHDGVAAGRFECADPHGSARRISALLDGLGLDVILHGGPPYPRLLRDARIAATAEVGLRARRTSDEPSCGCDQVIDPATGSVITEIPSASPDDVAHAVDIAATAFPSWSSTTPRERAEMLHSIADGIEARATELGDLESRNAGKPITAMPEEIDMCVDTLRFFAGSARTMDGRAAGEYLEDHTSFVRRDPVGVVAAITPWNYPLMMAAWKVGPALAAGNTLVLKPSELTPLTTILLGEIAAEVLPAGVMQVVCGRGATTGAALVADPRVALDLVHGVREHRPGDRHCGVRTT